MIDRPSSCPAPGSIPAFDAGWEAHEVGLERATVEALSANPRWSLLAWDMREFIAKERELTLFDADQVSYSLPAQVFGPNEDSEKDVVRNLGGKVTQPTA